MPSRAAPVVDADVTGNELSREVLSDLKSLAAGNAEEVARRLVMVARLLEVDPEGAYAHARAAQRQAGRVGAVREAAGLAAYRAGHYAEALAELRAARRITGSSEHLPVMADCERGLGRPERALQLAGSPEAGALGLDVGIEMRIVASGARTDMGQPDAAVLTLQVPELHAQGQHLWLARLRYAYAEALLAAGREAEGRLWLQQAGQADPQDETGAVERLAELDGVVFLDEDEPGEGSGHVDG